jgi:A/G-specific adenine glycosylase
LNARAFRKSLLAWYASGHRDLPWRNTRDPYRIWLSEIMLQQTRAAAAIPYYEQFLRLFPNVESLARAPENEVLAAWSGLGYYSRARNLRRAALTIAQKGAFPPTFDGIRALPGVGPYTAAAVASIAFGLPHAVLDGNVMRVIARLEADGTDIGSAAARARFQQIAQDLLDPAEPATFNQAMMELGATVCLPRDPLCLVCPVAAHCEARALGRQAEFPVKLRKAVPIDETLELVVVRRGPAVLMQQREASARRMADFWELPSLKDLPDAADVRLVSEFRHSIVNHRYSVSVFSGTASKGARMAWVVPQEDSQRPMTTITRKALACAETAR